MKAGEIKALKIVVDEVLPQVEAAECERLPVAYAAVAKAVIAALGPAIQVALDAKIDAIPVDPPPAA